MSRLVIIDGHAIAHRAYHSIPPLSNNGRPLNAIYGFYSMLLSVVESLKPKYLIVCLDSPGPTFRTTEFLGYRAKRKPADRDLVSQLPLIPQTLEIAKISSYSLGGYEADDLIATLTKRALKKYTTSKSHKKIKLVDRVTVVTGDKDLMQLVTNQVELSVPVRGLSESQLYDPDLVAQKLGVKPVQVIDLKALMGDMSDNYPGVEGIGPKTAIDLLTKYTTLDNIYLHLNDIGDQVRSRLEKYRDNAYLSQKLATLIDNIPLNFSLRSARWTRASAKNLIPLFQSYNFKSLISRVEKKYKPVKKPLSVAFNQTSFF